MKHTTILLCASALSLLSCACNSVTPAPIANENGQALAEPIPFYRGMQVIEEKNVPLCYALPASGDCRIADQVKTALRRSNATLVTAGSPSDVQLQVTHSLKNLKISTPTPQTRYALGVQVTMNLAPGGARQVLWQTEVSDQKAYTSAETAQNALIQQLASALDKEDLLANAERTLGVSVLRIAASRELVEINSGKFDTEISQTLSTLRKINGVMNVRLIEADNANRIASFRILYRKDALPQGIAARLRAIDAEKTKK